jgi:hypothetical protein
VSVGGGIGEGSRSEESKSAGSSRLYIKKQH